VVRPEILYANYPYLTSGSVTMQNHFDRLFDDLGIGELNSVVEIGSNDGKMLAHWRNRKPTLKVVGIDPARNLSSLAFGRNIGTVVSVFNREAAKAADAIKPELVIARHVFCTSTTGKNSLSLWRSWADQKPGTSSKSRTCASFWTISNSTPFTTNT